MASLLLNLQQGFYGPMVRNKNRTGFYPVNSEIFHRKMLIDKYEVNEHFSVKDFRIDRVKPGSVFISDHWPVKTLLKIQ